jgi:hypothetical protein
MILTGEQRSGKGEISKKSLSDITGGTKNKHPTPGNVIRMINKEIPQFIRVPVIEEIMKAILKPIFKGPKPIFKGQTFKKS